MYRTTGTHRFEGVGVVRATRDMAADRHWICARRLKERRLALGLTQADVVARIDGTVGLTNRSVSVWESGRGLDIAWLPELADALDCTVTYLLGQTEDPRSWQPDDRTLRATAAGSTQITAGSAQAAAVEAGAQTAGSKQIAAVDQPLHHNWILGPEPTALDTAARPPSSGSRRHVDQ